MRQANRFPHGLLWLGSTVFLIAYIGTLFVLLPETIVTHLTWSGEADSWSDRETGLSLLLLTLLLVHGVFYGFLRWIENIPIAILNVPWKNYWCANPDRKQEMYGRIRILLGVSGWYTNLIFLGVLVTVHQSTIRGDAESISLLTSVSAIVGSVILILWIYGFFRPPLKNKD